MNFLKKFGARIKYLRKKSGISQEIFAKKIGLHRTSVSRIESGKQFVEADTLARIKNILNTTYYELFKFEENTSPRSKKEYVEKIKCLLDNADEITLKHVLAILEI